MATKSLLPAQLALPTSRFTGASHTAVPGCPSEESTHPNQTHSLSLNSCFCWARPCHPDPLQTNAFHAPAFSSRAEAVTPSFVVDHISAPLTSTNSDNACVQARVVGWGERLPGACRPTWSQCQSPHIWNGDSNLQLTCWLGLT